MAISGLPSDGAQFPSRAELAADFSQFSYNPSDPNSSSLVDDISSLGANQGSAGYDQLNSGWLSAQGHEATYFQPDQFDGMIINSDQFGKNTKFQSQNMVILTDIPTSSTDYTRPRTLAAGYDMKSQTMTVVFRDGTFYNYYDVKPNEWLNFSASFSKGAPWLNRANSNQSFDGLFIGKPRGIADTNSLDPDLLRQLYLVASSHQQSDRRRQESRTHPGRVKGWEAKTGNKPFRTRTGYVPRAKRGRKAG